MSGVKDKDPDMSLRAAASGPSTPDESPIDDGLLLAFRAGTLSAASAELVEKRLARDPEARALLRELSQDDVTQADVDAVVDRLAPSNVVPLRARSRAVAWTSGAVALAAGLVAVVMAWPTKGTTPYVLEVEGGQAQTRGNTPATKLVLGPEERLTLRLRAEKPTELPRVVMVFREDENARLQRVEGAQIASARGSFEVQLEGAAWLGAAGAHRVWLHVATDEASATALSGRTQAEVADRGLGWWLLEVERRP